MYVRVYMCVYDHVCGRVVVRDYVFVRVIMCYCDLYLCGYVSCPCVLVVYVHVCVTVNYFLPM